LSKYNYESKRISAGITASGSGVNKNSQTLEFPFRGSSKYLRRLVLSFSQLIKIPKLQTTCGFGVFKLLKHKQGEIKRNSLFTIG